MWMLGQETACFAVILHCEEGQVLMKCPICGQELRPGKKDPNYLLCYNCKKKFKIPQKAQKVQKKTEQPEAEEKRYSNIPPKKVREKREQEMRDAYDELLSVEDGRKKKKVSPKPKRKEEIDLRNRAEGLIAQIDATLEDNRDKIDAKQADEVKKMRDDLQKSLDENNMDDVRTKLDALEKAAQAASASMYEQAGQQQSNDSNHNTNDDVVDGEYTEKN